MPVLIRRNTESPDQAPLVSKRVRRGATMMEYLMMISLVVVVCLVAIGFLGSDNKASMSKSTNSITKSLQKKGS